MVAAKHAAVPDQNSGTGAVEKGEKQKGRRGGAEYPRSPLKTALDYSDKLVSKTHTGPQAENTILAGVFNNAGGPGKIRAATLRKFGLLERTKDGIQASQLAKDIDAAADDQERGILLRRAVLSDKLFKALYETFHGDLVTKAKLRQRAQALKVHPDTSDECADFFMQSAQTAGLGAIEGDSIRLIPSTEVLLQNNSKVEPQVQGGSDSASLEETSSEEDGDHPDDPPAEQSPEAGKPAPAKSPIPRPRTAAEVSVHFEVNSSLDGEKLERHLELLRRFGLI